MPSTAFTLAIAPYAAGTRQPPHAHDDLQITVVLRGQLEERVGCATERAGALSVVVKDPGVVHDDQFGRSGALTGRLSLPGATFAQLVEHPRRAEGLEWRWTHDAAVARPLLRIVAAGAPHDDHVLDLLTALSARPAGPARGGPPRWLTAIADRIRDDWQVGLTVRDLAHDAGVHPVYLARCLRRWHGIGAAELLRRARLRRAAAAIAAGHDTIAAVAHATGFSDEAHLSRSFSQATGVPPARYRRWLRGFKSCKGGTPMFRHDH